MRFLVDECTGPAVSKWLRSEGHEVFCVFQQSRGATDDDILERAVDEDWIIITNDKDFGDKVFRDGYPHKGIVFLRLENLRSSNKIAVLSRFLEDYAPHLSDNFIVVTEDQVRFAKS